MKKRVLCWPVALGIAFWAAGGSNGDVRLVRESVWPAMPYSTIGVALDARQACSATRWRSFTDPQGQTVVEYRCEYRYARAYFEKQTRMQLSRLRALEVRQPPVTDGMRSELAGLRGRALARLEDFRKATEHSRWRILDGAAVHVDSFIEIEFASQRRRLPFSELNVVLEAHLNADDVSALVGLTLDRLWGEPGVPGVAASAGQSAFAQEHA